MTLLESHAGLLECLRDPLQVAAVAEEHRQRKEEAELAAGGKAPAGGGEDPEEEEEDEEGESKKEDTPEDLAEDVLLGKAEEDELNAFMEEEKELVTAV